ncbi:MAG: alpha/beta fold hydrolase [Mycobacteriaceae bacterium]
MAATRTEEEQVLAPDLDGFRAIDPRAIARAYPNELPQLADHLPEINAPVLIMAGRRDRVVPLASAEFLDERLTNGRDVSSNRRR